MNPAWYQVLSLLYGYLAAAVIAIIAIVSVIRLASDAALLRRMHKHTPQIGKAGRFRVLSAGTRRLPAGHEIPVPYEGTLGASHSCDVYIPFRRVHMRSAFFWMEKDGLHMAALHRDGFFVDEVPVEPGDEAVLYDGAVLRIRELKLVLHLYAAALDRTDDLDIGPYVTTARRTHAQHGHGEGIGAPGKGEARREQKRRQRLDNDAPAKKKKQTEKTASSAARRRSSRDEPPSDRRKLRSRR